MYAQPSQQLTDAKTYSKNILGPAYFEMSGLNITGTSDVSTRDLNAAPVNAPYLVSANEEFSVSLTIKFNKSPLTSLLMCLGTEVYVRFAFENIGDAVTEEDVEVMIMTSEGTYEYEFQWTGTPNNAQLISGTYGVAAVAQVGPIKHECSQPIIGYGYLAGCLLEVKPT